MASTLASTMSNLHARPSSNLISADQQPAVVDDYIGKEVREGRIAEVTTLLGCWSCK